LYRWHKIFLWIFLGIVFLIIGVFWIFNRSIRPPGTHKFIDFEVRPGETFTGIAKRLEENEIIRSAFAFRILIRLAGEEKGLKHGLYRVSSDMAPGEIIDKMTRGEVKTIWVTFPEGITADEMGGILQARKLMSKKEFIARVKKYETTIFDEHFKGIEGLLFPDTYNVATNITPEQMIEIMLNQFKKVITPFYLNRKQPVDLTLRESVILASMIEREATISRELPVMAGVYMNRLKAGMKLDCDATVQYILGWKPELTYSDLEVDSPYNTYLYPGLPPGPIGNPGREALRAVFRPADVPYYYYVLNWKKGDGSHIFSKNYRDHQRAIEEASI